MSNDKLNVVSEEQVFVAVMDWIKHNPVERSQYIAQVCTTTVITVLYVCLYGEFFPIKKRRKSNVTKFVEFGCSYAII